MNTDQFAEEARKQITSLLLDHFLKDPPPELSLPVWFREKTDSIIKSAFEKAYCLGVYNKGVER